MKRRIIKTADGSTTIHLEEWDEQYHSKHGAVQEAYHVFIKSGLDIVEAKHISLLEIGFGTGLNAFITYLEGEKRKISIEYVGVEAYPVSLDEVGQLNYVKELKAEGHQGVFDKMHALSWGEVQKVSPRFSLTKQQKMFSEIEDEDRYDLIYFDAFGARVQPELWTEAVFGLMYTALKKSGILVTYAAKGSVRRAMQAVGFMVERLPGPPGKREMLRAVKH